MQDNKFGNDGLGLILVDVTHALLLINELMSDLQVMLCHLATMIIVCIAVSMPPQKHHPLFLAKPSFNLQTIQAFFRQSSPAILIF